MSLPDTRKMLNEARSFLTEAPKISKAITNQVAKVNKYIAKHKKDDIYALEPDSTWEEMYEFDPVVIKGQFLYIIYNEVSKRGKKVKDRYNLNNEDSLGDAKWNLNWIVRSIKRGYKSEGQTAPKF
jgi:hypothetical protein